MPPRKVVRIVAQRIEPEPIELPVSRFSNSWRALK
jgi:hypothetical protein